MSEEQTNSYWSIVGRQFRKSRLAMFGLCCVVFLFLLAIYAPVISSNRPFFYSGPGIPEAQYQIRDGHVIELDELKQTTESSFPWFRDLFDRNYYTQPVDQFFNLLMLYLPLALAIFFILRAIGKRAGTWRGRRAITILCVLGFVNVWVFLGIALPDSVVNKPAWNAALAPGVYLRTSTKYQDYHARVAEAKAAGEDVTAFFPLVPYHYEDTRIKEALLAPDYFVMRTGGSDRAAELTKLDRKELDELAESLEIAEPAKLNNKQAVIDAIIEAEKQALGIVGKHPLGTELAGKDVMTIMLYGARISMTVGVIAVAIYCFIGIILGALAGYYGGWVDILISRLIEIFMSFPFLFFVLTVVAVAGTKSIFLVMGAIGIIGWTGVARLVRGEFLSQRGQDYVTAARALGIPQRSIIFRHVLPNSLTPVLVSATFGIASAILVESSISFLGLGDPLASSWGGLLNIGRHNTPYWWLIFPPGVAIFFTVTAFNLVGEGLRDALDPKLRQ